MTPGQETVLVVEDEEGVRELVRDVLEMNGYRVLEAATGEEALRLAARHAAPIQLLVADLSLPDLRGRDLVQRLVGERPHLRVLFISGHHQEATAVQRELGSGGRFLSKPFTVRALLSAVSDLSYSSSSSTNSSP